MQQVAVSVPATSANLGPGFDALGMALDLVLELEIREASEDAVLGHDNDPEIPPPAENLVFRAAAAAYQAAGKARPPLAIETRSAIPLSRGLGSSAAAAVAGLVGANALLGGSLDMATLLRLATRLEGHPDNVAPALAGGMTVSAAVPGGDVATAAIAVHPAIRAAIGLVLIIPGIRLSTAAARAALPREVSHADATFNAARASLLVAALAGGRPDLLAEALRDRLHQPYRAALVLGMERMLVLGRELGAHAITISGAGPTLLAWCPRDRTEAIGRELAAAWEVGAEARWVEIAEAGAHARPLI